MNYFVKLKDASNIINNAFAAAWEKELEGIKSEKDFVKYIYNEIIKLNNPLEIELNR